MRKCRKCTQEIPLIVLINGKPRNLQRRKFCLICSPFGSHNTRPDAPHTTDFVCKHHGSVDFAITKNGRRCRKCRVISVTNFRRKIKRKLVELLGGKCCCCGYDKCVTSLHFHHIDPTTKKFNISHTNIKSWEKILEEAKKCRLVCANCHGEIEEGVRDCP